MTKKISILLILVLCAVTLIPYSAFASTEQQFEASHTDANSLVFSCSNNTITKSEMRTLIQQGKQVAIYNTGSENIIGVFSENVEKANMIVYKQLNGKTYTFILQIEHEASKSELLQEFSSYLSEIEVELQTKSSYISLQNIDNLGYTLITNKTYRTVNKPYGFINASFSLYSSQNVNNIQYKLDSSVEFTPGIAAKGDGWQNYSNCSHMVELRANTIYSPDPYRLGHGYLDSVQPNVLNYWPKNSTQYFHSSDTPTEQNSSISGQFSDTGEAAYWVSGSYISTLSNTKNSIFVIQPGIMLESMLDPQFNYMGKINVTVDYETKLGWRKPFKFTSYYTVYLDAYLN